LFLAVCSFHVKQFLLSIVADFSLCSAAILVRCGGAPFLRWASCFSFTLQVSFFPGRLTVFGSGCLFCRRCSSQLLPRHSCDFTCPFFPNVVNAVVFPFLFYVHHVSAFDGEMAFRLVASLLPISFPLLCFELSSLTNEGPILSSTPHIGHHPFFKKFWHPRGQRCSFFSNAFVVRSASSLSSPTSGGFLFFAPGGKATRPSRQ